MAVYKRVMLKLSGEALKSGADLFDFDLNDEEMNYIDSLNRRERSYADPDNFNF